MRILRIRDSADLPKDTPLLKSRGEIQTRSLKGQMQAPFTSFSMPRVGRHPGHHPGRGVTWGLQLPPDTVCPGWYFALAGALNTPDTAHVLTCPLWLSFPGLWFWTRLTRLEMWLVKTHRGGSGWQRRLKTGSVTRAARTRMGLQWAPGMCRWRLLITLLTGWHVEITTSRNAT